MPADLRRNAFLSDVLTMAPSMGKDLALGRLLAGQKLFEPGADEDRVYFPLDSVVAYVVAFSDGTRVETLSVGREGAVGRRALTVPGQELTVELGGDVATLSLNQLLGEARANKGLDDLFERYQAFMFGALAQRTACFAAHRPAARLATWILFSSYRVGSALLITHERLSHLLATRRATVSVALEELQQQGAVTLGRARLRTTDEACLRAVACECYDALAPWLLHDALESA